MTMPEGKSQHATAHYLRLILKHEDVLTQIADAVHRKKADAELVRILQSPFFALNNKIRTKLPKARSQAEWRGMFARNMSMVDWDWLASTVRLAYERGEAT